MTIEQFNQSRPWLAADGTLLPDETIKAISHNWSAETWELFLTETVEKESSYQRDLPAFVSPAALDSFSETIWEGSTSERMDAVTKGLRRICRDNLTPRQQHIIRATFWQGLSERQIAELLDVSRSTVRTQKLRALEKIKTQVIAENLLGGGRHKERKAMPLPGLTQNTLVNSSIGNGHKQNSCTNEEQVRSVYEAETKKTNFVFRTGGVL